MCLRIGIIGYGLVGRYFHAPLLKGCGFDVVVIQTINARRITGHDFPKVHVVATVEELVAHVDLVVAVSANLAHADHAYVAIKAGTS